MKTKKEEQGLRVKSTPFFKLKKNQGKHYVGINMRKQFGFLPENIIVERSTGRNNVIRVIAVLTEEEIKKEDKLKIEK